MPPSPRLATGHDPVVAAGAQALDCLRLARENPSDAPLALKCTARFASMMRQARSARSLLMRVQAQRRKREADNASLDKAAWIEHCAIGPSPAPARSCAHSMVRQRPEPRQA
jgi:hypothetical protein